MKELNVVQAPVQYIGATEKVAARKGGMHLKAEVEKRWLQ